MTNIPVHVRLEPHVIELVDQKVDELDLRGKKGMAGGRAEYCRRLIYEHFGEPLPQQSQYLPQGEVSNMQTVNRRAKPLKTPFNGKAKESKVSRAKPARPAIRDQVVRANSRTGAITGSHTSTVITDDVSNDEHDKWTRLNLPKECEPSDGALNRTTLPSGAVVPERAKTVAPIDPTPTRDDVPGQTLIDGGEVGLTLETPGYKKHVDDFLCREWDEGGRNWVDMPGVLKREFGTDFGLSGAACRARYRRAKAKYAQGQGA